MELEVRDVNPSLRLKYMHRILSYKAELTRLSQEFSRIRNKTGISCKHCLEFSDKKRELLFSNSVEY